MTDLWVIGGGGLLGSAIRRSSGAGRRCFTATPIPWHSAAESATALAANLVEFHRWRAPERPWAIVWAAGAGVIASSPAQLESESHVLLEFAALVDRVSTGHGCFLFASSASVFGAGQSVSDETSTPAPANGYARAKLAQERALTCILHGAAPLVVGRISTLYGPGQNLSKGQGLISSMCSQALHQRAISVFVPLDTTRDYLLSTDAAQQCLALIDRATARGPVEPLMRVVASHRSTSVGELAGLVQAVAHRRTRILQVQTASTSLHVRHLSLTSTDATMRQFLPTPLAIGVRAVYSDLFRRYMAARGTPAHVG